MHLLLADMQGLRGHSWQALQPHMTEHQAVCHILQHPHVPQQHFLGIPAFRLMSGCAGLRAGGQCGGVEGQQQAAVGGMCPPAGSPVQHAAAEQPKLGQVAGSGAATAPDTIICLDTQGAEREGWKGLAKQGGSCLWLM